MLAVTPSGTISARALGERFPSEGAELTSGRGEFSGTVLRVFGPVGRPYLSVRPRRPLGAREATALIGTTLSSR